MQRAIVTWSKVVDFRFPRLQLTILMIILDEHTMNGGEPGTTFFYVKDTVPRAVRLKSEDMFKLLTNCGDFIFSL